MCQAKTLAYTGGSIWLGCPGQGTPFAEYRKDGVPNSIDLLDAGFSGDRVSSMVSNGPDELFIAIKDRGIKHVRLGTDVRNFGLSRLPMHFLATRSGQVEIVVDEASHRVTEDGYFELHARPFDNVIYTPDDQSWIVVDGMLGTGFDRFGDAEGVRGSATDLALARNGAIWIATDRGVSRLANGEFTNFELGGAANDAQRLLVDREDRVWVGTRGGLFVYDGIRFNPVSGLPGEHVNDLALDKNGTLWAATATGLGRRTGASAFTRLDIKKDGKCSTHNRI